MEEFELKGSYCWEAGYILPQGIRDKVLRAMPLKLKFSAGKE